VVTISGAHPRDAAFAAAAGRAVAALELQLAAVDAAAGLERDEPSRRRRA
jgi:hypothetical protein